MEFEKFFLKNINGLYKERTSAIKTKIDNEGVSIYSKLNNSIVIYRERRLILKVLKRVDFYVTWVKGNFIELKSIVKSDSHFLSFYYYNKEYLGFESQLLSHSGIVVGNSADPSNNHIDALEFLSNVNYKDEIIIPFSYGGTLAYRQKVTNYSKVYFQHLTIKFLTDFLPISDYNALIDSVGGFLFFHSGQQAAGNYIAAFFMMKPVYFSYRTTMIDEFEDLEFILYSLDKFDKYSTDDLLINCKIAHKLFTSENSSYNLTCIYKKI